MAWCDRRGDWNLLSESILANSHEPAAIARLRARLPEFDTLSQMIVAAPRSLGSKGLHPLVTTTDSTNSTQQIKAAVPVVPELDCTGLATPC